MLQAELQQRGLPIVCLEAFHARAALSAMHNKTDRADAQGIAHNVRAGWFRQVQVKSNESYRLRLLLTHRRDLKRKFLDIENAIRHSIKAFGLKLGSASRGEFEARVRELKAYFAAKHRCGFDPLLRNHRKVEDVKPEIEPRPSATPGSSSTRSAST